MATFPVGPSASRTMPYVPAPRVRPKRYFDLNEARRVESASVGNTEQVKGSVLLASNSKEGAICTFCHSCLAGRGDG